MNKLFKQFVAFAIAAVMVIGILPVSALAVEHDHDHSSTVSGLEPFTSTEDLIKQVQEKLYESGKIHTSETASKAEVAAVEGASDYTYSQAMTMLALGFFGGQGAKGTINTAALNLSVSTMNALVETTLKAYSLTDNVVKVNYEQEDGVVTAVNFELTESFAQVMDEITGASEATAATGSVVAANTNTAATAADFPFTDVSEAHWARDYVEYVYFNGLMNGMSATLFKPGTTLSRAMVVTILYRMEGEPAVTGTNPFTDVKADQWYTNAVIWANANGITTGMNATTFAPNNDVTREQMVTFLGRYAEYCGMSTATSGSLSQFTDGSTISSWAQPYVLWAAANGIVNGYENADGTYSFKPKNTATRAEFAKIITVYCSQAFSYVAEVAPTCCTTGKAAHYINRDGLILDAQGNVVTDESTLILPATGHAPAEDASMVVWNRIDTESEEDEYALYFDAETGEITAGLAVTTSWNATAAEFTCAGCGGTFSATITNSYYVMTEEWIDEQLDFNTEGTIAYNIVMEIISNYVANKAMAYYNENGVAPSDEQINAWVAAATEDPEVVAEMEAQITAKAMELYQDMDSVIYVADCAGDGIAARTEKLNATVLELQENWATMTSFNAYYPEYFGLVAPYWNSKNTETSPLGAFIYMCSMEEMDLVPNSILAYYVDMISQAFMSYVMSYADLLDAMIDDALATVNYDALDDIDKLLLLHDWLATYGTFDMQSLIDITDGTSSGSDPISMTAFGVLLNEQIEKDEDATWDGGVCLGYAATYALLIQQAFGLTQEDEAMVDFVKIQYLTNVAESSVAAGDSGFGDGDAMFNSAHYLNAVKLGDNWYYIDACYDDINIEVISQYRVETDGNISHSSFLLAPSTWEEMYEDNFQYMDSLYDGKVWARVYDGESGYYKMDKDGNLYTAAEAAEMEEADEELQLFYYYEATTTSDETRYEDTTYEESWFVACDSRINYDNATGYFYYTAGSNTSYSALKDMFGDADSGSSGMADSMTTEDMMSYKSTPSAQDKIVRRPVDAPNTPENTNSMMGMGSTDSYADVLFHFGYGSIGAEAQADYDTDASNDSYSTEGAPVITDDQKGPYYNLCEVDAEFYNMYPDLTHSTVIVDGKIYFSIGTAVYTFNHTISELAAMTPAEMTDLALVEVRDYDKISYTSNGKRFTGMSFVSSSSGTTLYNHPIAALSVRDDFTNDGAETLYVSIGTNLSNSYENANDEKYKVEALNYNSSYYRFMEDDEESTADDNTNTEFMWCANIVDKMVVSTMLSELSGSGSSVTVSAFCGVNEYTQTRSSNYGLSLDSKAVTHGSALAHNYSWNTTEGCYVCSKCNHCTDHKYEAAITWSFIAAEGDVPEKLTASAAITCTDDGCETTATATCTITETTADDVTTYIAEVLYEGDYFTATHTHSYDADGVCSCGAGTLHEHTFELTGTWTLGENEMVLKGAQLVCVDDCGYNSGTVAVGDIVASSSTNDLDEVTYTASYTVDGVTYTATHEHELNVKSTTSADCETAGETVYECDCGYTYTDTLNAPGHSMAVKFNWASDNTCQAEYYCKNCDLESEYHTCAVTSTTTATCTKDGETTYTATVTIDGKEYKDTKTVDTKKTGHTEEPVPGKAATCTEDGLTDGTKCSVCGKTTKAQERIPAPGHSYDPTTGKCSCGATDPNYTAPTEPTEPETQPTEPTEPETQPTEPTEPETTVPETTVPETTVPETTVPETTVPETTVPETTVPETTVPETTVPETTVPETTVPETTVPETTVPETTGNG